MSNGAGMSKLKRPSIWMSRRGFVGAGLGAALAVVARLMGPPQSALFNLLAGSGMVIAGYALGVLAAGRRREIEDIAYILRLREELRACQDHIMDTATFESLGAYLEIAAHQMKEPLQGVAAGVRALAADASLPEEARASIAALKQNLETLQATLRHLASYALTKPGRAPFSVNTVLRDAIHLCRHRAEEKNIRFDERYAVIPPVFGPAGRVHRAILNLVVNAVEAMPFGGGTILVESAYENERVIARVRDGGIGIRPEHLGKIFDPFFSTKPERSGIGLGLWAVKQTFDLIGADVTVKSEPHQGTEISILFPQAAPLRPGREGTEHPPELPQNTAEERGRQIA
ncbi:MAG: hypothetical protein DMF50_11880 [Acidobacteria bacterium]|nr:MAG: hypothetical protein DMF50_11880 [Acidobacteriota bacterium]